MAAFKWSLDGTTAPYSFHVKNHTNDPIGIFVTIVAESISEGVDGVDFLPLGGKNHDLRLAPREERQVDGVVEMLRQGTSSTVLTISADQKTTNDDS